MANRVDLSVRCMSHRSTSPGRWLLPTLAWYMVAKNEHQCLGSAGGILEMRAREAHAHHRSICSSGPDCSLYIQSRICSLLSSCIKPRG